MNTLMCTCAYIEIIITYRSKAKNKSPVSGHRSASNIANVIRVYAVIGTRPKFHIHKVWWLRQASQIGQTFIPLCEKRRLKHSAAEFQSIQQFSFQSQQINKKLIKILTRGSEATRAETRNRRLLGLT